MIDPKLKEKVAITTEANLEMSENYSIGANRNIASSGVNHSQFNTLTWFWDYSSQVYHCYRMFVKGAYHEHKQTHRW
jgi:hypothetical protein